MKKIPRRCGASLPKERADEGWYRCDQKQGHTGNHTDHTDGVKEWRDQDTVCVVSYDNVRAVPDHVHDFIGDGDECQEPGCTFMWGDHMRQQTRWEQEQADICSFCGHDNARHTFEAPDEGGRDYCTECDGADEFHSFDEPPQRPEVSRERLLEAVRGLLGSDVPQERLEAAVDRMRVMLALTDPEPAREPQESPQARLDAMRVRVEGVRPRGVVMDEIPQDDDPAEQCACGRIWPDGVMGKGHNFVGCEPEPDPDEDICACGCKRKHHRESVNWGHSCDGCTAKGPRATYQWRHPFVLVRG